MTAIARLATMLIAAWLGVMAFFSFVVAPLVFRMVDRAVAGEVVAGVLPRYYAWGLALAGLALLALLADTLLGRRGVLRLASVACAAGLVGILAWTLAVSLPHAEAARRARDDRAFVAAHRSAVALNLACMALAVGALVSEVFRRERTRAERTRGAS